MLKGMFFMQRGFCNARVLLTRVFARSVHSVIKISDLSLYCMPAFNKPQALLVLTPYMVACDGNLEKFV